MNDRCGTDADRTPRYRRRNGFEAYYCAICRDSFSSRTAFRDHWRDDHTELTMTNTRRKGQSNERELDEIFEAVGFETYRPDNVAYSDNDIFGLFDVGAIRPGDAIWLVQCKTNSADGIRDWMEKAETFYAFDPVETAYAVRHDREGWRLMRPTPNANSLYQTVVDERKTGGDIGDDLREYLSHD